jgi:limonene-1,2-epoxide hydrolase
MEPERERRLAVLHAMVDAHQALDWERAGSLLDDDCVYQCMMAAPISGREAIVRAFQTIPGMTSIKFVMRNIVIDGEIVFFERDDELVVSGRNLIVPAVGVMRIRQRIAEWREYFDSTELSGLLAMQGHNLAIG